MNKVSIRLLWHAQAQFAGCLLAEHGGIAARRGLALSCLDAEPGRAALADCLQADGLQGGAKFAVASPSHVAECANPRALRVVLVLHDLALAMNHADRVLVLDKGMVAADGAPESALLAELITRVWGVGVRWLGEPGARALVAG